MKINSKTVIMDFFAIKEFYPSGIAASNLEAWESAMDTLATKSKAKFVQVSMPNVVYSMSCYSVLTSCEVASNFARYDGIQLFSRLTKKKLDQNHRYSFFEKVLNMDKDRKKKMTSHSKLC